MFALSACSTGDAMKAAAPVGHTNRNASQPPPDHDAESYTSMPDIVDAFSDTLSECSSVSNTQLTAYSTDATLEPDTKKHRIC